LQRDPQLLHQLRHCLAVVDQPQTPLEPTAQRLEFRQSPALVVRLARRRLGVPGRWPIADAVADVDAPAEIRGLRGALSSLRHTQLSLPRFAGQAGDQFTVDTPQGVLVVPVHAVCQERSHIAAKCRIYGLQGQILLEFCAADPITRLGQVQREDASNLHRVHVRPEQRVSQVE